MGQEDAFATGIPPDIYAFHTAPGILLPSPTFESNSIERPSPVEPGAFTLDLYDRLRALYAQ